ncbi:hypothetical protein DFH09DRAFT_1415887 [Mycena vulgaris]|nr:hypothetical protein DFH09DRAFT_1415887 [Mycena vulgaris]
MLASIDYTSPVLDSVLHTLAITEVELSDVDSVCGSGITTAAEYRAMSVKARNRCVIDAVRDACRKGGYFSGWQCLANVASACSAVRGAAGLQMVITRATDRDSIYQVAPKSVGGVAWKQSEEYTPEAQRVWCNTSFAPMSPCASFIWLSVQRKTVARDDLDVCNALTLLGTVDFDFDRIEPYRPGFAHAMELAGRHVASRYVRRVQENWVAGGKGAANVGPRAISPKDWIATMVGDCGALCTFGYEDTTSYAESRATMLVALLMPSIYDPLYDRATSNLVSSVMYVAGAGVAQYDVHTVFLTITDKIARRARDASGTDIPLYGDSSLLATGASASFNEWYRTWERFVKYTRQLRGSSDPAAQRVLAMADRALVLRESNVTEAWCEATTPGAQDTLIQRPTVAYTPSPVPGIASLSPPDICGSFREALQDSATDTIHGIAGLPTAVIAAPAVSRAEALRRAALFACSSGCCESCACRIGCCGPGRIRRAHRIDAE